MSAQPHNEEEWTPVTEKTCRIRLSAGNIRNHHFGLAAARSLLPPAAISGKAPGDRGQAISVRFMPGSTVLTDVSGGQMIFRNRSAIREFFEASAAQEGDVVVLEVMNDGQVVVTLEE